MAYKYNNNILVTIASYLEIYTYYYIANYSGIQERCYSYLAS